MTKVKQKKKNGKKFANQVKRKPVKNVFWTIMTYNNMKRLTLESIYGATLNISKWPFDIKVNQKSKTGYGFRPKKGGYRKNLVRI